MQNPDVWSLCSHAGINACISVGKLTEARTLLKNMQQQNIPPDIRVFNILLKGYSRKGGVSAVPGILQEMTDAGLKPSAVTYNTLIDTYVRAGQLLEARQTCTNAQAAGQTTRFCQSVYHSSDSRTIADAFQLVMSFLFAKRPRLLLLQCLSLASLCYCTC